jgi:hypothetical protein
MKIDAAALRRIIREELARLNENPEGEAGTSTAKLTDPNAQKVANTGEKNVQMQRSAEKAVEKGPAALSQSILADLQKYLNKGSNKKDIIGALKLALPKIQDSK